HHRSLDGEALCQRGGLPRRRLRRPDPRRLRVYPGIPRRAHLPGREALHHRRRNERGPADDHRSRPSRELKAVGLADRVLAGETRAAARLMRLIDDNQPAAEAELRALFPRTGRAQIVGITGNPGAGKSTLVDRLIAHLRAAGKTVGVLAVDPTSPFTGGAILGDRIRMQDHALDPGVFIRSLATRGQLGGLSRATSDCVRVLDAMGKDVVIVETVGVGQDEVEICRLAHTTVVVVVPGLGDDIQAIKAGILEVADLFCVNKADREGADRTVRDLRQMLELSTQEREMAIVKCVATQGEGTAELWKAIEDHYRFLKNGPGLLQRETQRARYELIEIL